MGEIGGASASGSGSGDRTATATVLFTDVVGSTEERARLGEDEANRVWRELESRFTEIAARHHGRIVKSLGDGVLAVFEAAADAVAAAVSMQLEAGQLETGQLETGQLEAGQLEAGQLVGGARRGRASSPTLNLRVGLASGDVAFSAADVFGSPVVEASRLCGAAQPGQILVADVVRSLSRGRGAHVFESVGELPLKGLPEPVAACQVIWQPLITTDPEEPALPLPGLLSTGVAVPYVGREDVIDRLAALWKGVSDQGGSAAVLLSGEPGVGKTRTASEVAHLAYSGGGVVLYGRCDEDLGVPFQPFVEALDFYSGNHSAPRLGRLSGELARLCPELPQRVSGLPSPVSSDPQTEEYRVFEAVTSWLVEASKESGLALVVDDLHWATRATLLLLHHVLKGAAADSASKLLVIGTYRDTELDRVHPLTAVLADLRRLPSVQRVDLGGLSLDETVSLVERAAGHELDGPSRQLAEAAYSETEGNPFFVGEVLRHFVETGQVRLVEGRWEVSDPGHVDVPEGVKDVIGRRLGRLSETANRVLSVASVIGRDFDLELLGWVVDLDEMSVVDALDEASRARMIEETGPEQFRFYHAMVRDTLYEELSAPRRRRLHHQVVEVLEKLRPHDSTALAYHALEAGGTGGDMSRTVSYLLEAARNSAIARDLSGAERFYGQAIEILDAEEPDPIVRLEALCGLGEVQRDQSNPAFRETLLEAGRRALELHQTDLAARACIANFRGFSSIVNEVDEDRVGVLKATVDAVQHERGAQWALLTATLAAEIIYDRSVAHQERLGLVDGALRAARELGDPRLLAEVIIRVYQAALVPDRWIDARGLSDEAIRLADETSDPTLQALARLDGASGYLGVGEIARAQQLVSEALEISERDCPPFVLVAAKVNYVQYLCYSARMEEAQSLNSAAQALGNEIGMVDVDQWCVVNIAGFAGVRGELGDMADLIDVFADQYPASVAWRCAQVRSLVEAGRFDEARSVIDRFRLDRPAEFAVDPFLLTGWSHLAVAAMFLRDGDLGCAIAEVLQPYKDLWIHYVIYVAGPATWSLALSAAAQGLWDEALSLFQESCRELHDRGMVTNELLVSRDFSVAFAECPSAEYRSLAREQALSATEQVSALSGFERLERQIVGAVDSYPA